MKHYAVHMAVIVDACFELGTFEVSEAKKRTAVEVWTETLYPVIPEPRLADAFREAVRRHTGNRAISAYELKGAYETLEKREQEKRERTDKEFQATKCSQADKVHYMGEPVIMVVDMFDPEHDVAIPCFYCRREEHDKLIDERLRRFNALPDDQKRPFQIFMAKALGIERWAMKKKGQGA